MKTLPWTDLTTPTTSPADSTGTEAARTGAARSAQETTVASGNEARLRQMAERSIRSPRYRSLTGIDDKCAGSEKPPVRGYPATASAASGPGYRRSEEHTYELQSLMRISYAVICLKQNHVIMQHTHTHNTTDYPIP